MSFSDDASVFFAHGSHEKHNEMLIIHENVQRPQMYDDDNILNID